jgi:hypothetical protein
VQVAGRRFPWVVRRVERDPGQVALALGLRPRGHRERLVDRVGRGVSRRGRGHAVNRLRPAEVARQVAEVRMPAGVTLPAVLAGVVLAPAQVPLADIRSEVARSQGGVEHLGEGHLTGRERRHDPRVGVVDASSETVAAGQDLRPSGRAPRARPDAGEQDALPRQRLEIRHRRRRRRCRLLPGPQGIKARCFNSEIVGNQKEDVRSGNLCGRCTAQPDDSQPCGQARKVPGYSGYKRHCMHPLPYRDTSIA